MASPFPPLGGITPTTSPTPAPTNTVAPGPTSIPALAPSCSPSWEPIANPASPSALRGITAINDHDAWAVGDNGVLRWGGTGWFPVPIPTPADLVGSNKLLAISSRTAGDIWATGTYSNGTNARSTAYHWDGISWSLIYTSTGSEVDVLAGVAPLGEGDAVFVGYKAQGQPPTIRRCNILYPCTDDQWPNPVISGTLNAVDTYDYNYAAWAVGSVGDTSLVMHFGSGPWEQIDVPNIGELTSVTVVSDSGSSGYDVWAVSPEGGILHGNGVSWQTTVLPFHPYAISAVDYHDIWAVGSSDSPNLPNIYHYDGTHWTGVSAQADPALPLLAASSRTFYDAWAVGESGTIQRYQYPDSSHYAQQFEDSPPDSTFYPYIQRLTCRAIANGYPCGSPGEPCGTANLPYFRPGNLLTRGQLTKIVTLAANIEPDDRNANFEDVPLGSTFNPYVQALYGRGAVTGYPCGGPGEPCNPPLNRPYFRPQSNATRGQVTRIVAISAQLYGPIDSQTFEDVPPDSTFYIYIENMAVRNVISGYPCGGPGEPCNPPTNRPYFRPSNNITRGQMSKITINTLFP
jgi:hypothetical protein